MNNPFTQLTTINILSSQIIFQGGFAPYHTQYLAHQTSRIQIQLSIQKDHNFNTSPFYAHSPYSESFVNKLSVTTKQNNCGHYIIDQQFQQMDKKPAIQFTEVKQKFTRNQSDLTSTLNEDDFKSVLISHRKSSHAKKFKPLTKPQQQIKHQQLNVCHSFNFSLSLLNLLREPVINNNKFETTYVDALSSALSKIINSTEEQYEEITLYLHLILAQVDNLEEMDELGASIKDMTKLNKKKWNSTNLMNVKCLQVLIKRIKEAHVINNNNLIQKEVSEVSSLRVNIVKNNNIYLFDQDLIILSKNYVELALQSMGHLDVYFGPFILNKFTFEASLWFNNFNDNEQALNNYAIIFQQISNEGVEFSNINYEQWYQQQIKKIVNNQFYIDDLIPYLNYTRFNPWIQKLLIGLQGWKTFTDSAIKLLNVFYDNCDWQLNSQYNSVIRVTGDPFIINYLIDNPKQHQQTLIYCLKAPCFDQSIPLQIFSWHIPKLVQYLYDDISYVWAQMDFGLLPRSGFYDFVMFNLFDHGKEAVYKVLDIGTKHQILKEAAMGKKPVLSVRSVKGRMVVQPPKIRDLSLHEVIIDSLTPDQGLYRTATFEDATKQIQKLSHYNIDTVYLSGVFQRDNEESTEIYKKPHASSTALTHRNLACKMLGGEQGLKALVKKAHSLGIKILVDSSIRVSSSRMSKRYQGLLLKAVDQKGRLVFHYGSNGRSVSYEDTTPLNYRKKQSWDLLINQAYQVIQKYQIDGFYLDNAFDWPILYKLNDEELFRREYPNNTPAYTDKQIFQGEIIIPSKIAGFWGSPLHATDPNPFFIKFCKQLWEKHPKLIIIAQQLEIPEHDSRLVSIIRSGPIIRSLKMPKALSQIVGVHLSNNGEISQTMPKNINNMKKWYQQSTKALPIGAIVINSTTSPVWPNIAYVFRQATWAVIDLLFLMPSLVMTSGSQLQGKAYKSKAININYLPADPDRQDVTQVTSGIKQKAFNRAGSSFMQEEYPKLKRGNIVHCTNTVLKDITQTKYLEDSIRREVGPEFGFDLAEIHKHYNHRRQLRKNSKLIREGKLLSLSAQHIYGIHNNVLSFVRYSESELLLISVNFNSDAIDMHYNLTQLKHLFKHYQRSNIVLKIEDLLQPGRFNDQYYLVGELISSRIQAHIDPYKTIIWKLTIQQDNHVQKALQCSKLRIKEKLSRTPPAWIYSSPFFTQLNHLINSAKTQSAVVKGLNQLYNQCILPHSLNFSLVIGKYYQFYLNKHKLQKIFGIFKLISNHTELNTQLKDRITNMLSNNTLGPIAFVTPQIGAWSSVGGLGVMVDELSKQLARIGEEVYIITPYYEYNKKKETNYLAKDGFVYHRNIKVVGSRFEYQFGIHTGKYCGVNYIWFHNPELFSKPYDGEGAMYVSKQLVYFALTTLQIFCQLKIFPSIVVTNDWMCGFVSAYVKHRGYQVFGGTKFMHIVHNLDPLYEGRLYPKFEQGNLQWLIGLPTQWYTEIRNNKLIINPSKCALQTCDNWGTVSHSYKVELLKESPLAGVLWKHPHPFSFPNGIRKDERCSILRTKTPGTHAESKVILQQRYFKCEEGRPEVPLFAFIGRVTRQKGVHLILDAVQTLLHQYNFNIQFLVGGSADSKEDYGKYCADKMKFLNYKYPHCFWSNPDNFFSDGPLVNIGSDFAMMPSMFEPGGIVQHQFFCGGTPVIAFCTGGLKDTVFEYDIKSQKGNGFNFLSYDLQDFKKCMRRALQCYKNRAAYEKLRQNAFESIVEEQDVARGWNNEFYRLQNKIYIDWIKVEREIEQFTKNTEAQANSNEEIKLFDYKNEDHWKPEWEVIKKFKDVLQSASRLKVKSHTFCYETKKIPRPKEVFVIGSWDNWQSKTKLIFSKIYKNYKGTLKLKPDTYFFKFLVDNEWIISENQEKEEDHIGNINHKVVIQ